MSIKTGVIRFNVRDRGRRFRGQDRNFDTAALAALINSGEVQEKVKQGDMVGYYGHWPRVKFGLDVEEGSIVGGKVIALEPAIRTTYLKAYPDGTIEHETEILDTAPGRLVQRLYRSKTGGFSSAMNAPRRGSMQVPTSFHGFDYVLEPNYATNRGYALDSAGNRIEIGDLSEEEEAVLDAVDEYTSMVAATTQMFDRVQAEYDRMAEVMDGVQQENVELQSMVLRLRRDLAARPVAAPDPAEAGKAVLDSVVLPEAKTLFVGAESFQKANLQGFEAADAGQDKPKTAADRYIGRMLRIGR